MHQNRNQKQSNSIPLVFLTETIRTPLKTTWNRRADRGYEDVEPVVNDSGLGGPDLAELVASRSELKRLQHELGEAKEGLARRQADFETTASESSESGAKLTSV